jgi:hypothetical protein
MIPVEMLREASEEALHADNQELRISALKTALAVAAFGGVVLGSNCSSAMPVGGPNATLNELSTDVQKVVWACAWDRCWWRPGYYYYRYSLYYRPYFPFGWPGRPRYWGMLPNNAGELWVVPTISVPASGPPWR